MDVHSKKTRSFNMSQIKSINTKPEIKFRKVLWKTGVRGYRVKTKIYGKPDIYFPKKKLAIFIDGCFWHKCKVCYKEPKSNQKFWINKIEANINRDSKVNSILKTQNIYVVRIWEHLIREDVSYSVSKISKILTS